MRLRLYATATLLPLVLLVVSLVMGVTGLADPCPGPGSGGC